MNTEKEPTVTITLPLSGYEKVKKGLALLSHEAEKIYDQSCRTYGDHEKSPVTKGVWDGFCDTQMFAVDLINGRFEEIQTED